MNLPNKLTMLRIFMIPLFLFFFFMYSIPMNYLWAFIVFAAASLTDMLDGQIARKYGLITDFGKLMDPLADKLLVISALCCLCPTGEPLYAISLILILSREFFVTSIRLIAAGKGEVLAADIWGKVKTVTQMIWICAALLHLAVFGKVPAFEGSEEAMLMQGILYCIQILFFVMVSITVASGVHYIVKNRKLFSDM